MPALTFNAAASGFQHQTGVLLRVAQPQVAITRAFYSTVARLILFYLLTLALMLAVLPWTQASGIVVIYFWRYRDTVQKN